MNTIATPNMAVQSLPPSLQADVVPIISIVTASINMLIIEHNYQSILPA